MEGINSSCAAGPSFFLSPTLSSSFVPEALPAIATMRISTASTLLFGTLRAAACPTGSSAIDEYIEAERIVALEQLLCNIGDDGCNAAGADPGVVVASPSKSDPDCMVLCIPSDQNPHANISAQTGTRGPGIADSSTRP